MPRSRIAIAASLLVSLAQAASRSEYLSNAINATDILNQIWYDSSNGQWQDLWWNSANMITTIADLAALDTDLLLPTANYYFQNTLVQAPVSNGGSFLNDFYDDEAWWAMAWIKVYDITQNSTYLDTAKAIFDDLVNGDDATCGGHWWSKDKTDNTAIGNELYLAVAASLANRVGDQRSYYQDIVTKQVDWFLNSGLINEENRINDGLDLSTCEPRGEVYTYNQGVILGALVEMHCLTSDQSYLDTASDIAHATTGEMVESTGILTEPGFPDPPDTTGAQFKGVFTRNLAILQSVAGDDAYVRFLRNNADTLWTQDRQGDGQIGPHWQGPYLDASAASQSSALDCLVAAAAVSS